jgi:hypothetical protein
MLVLIPVREVVPHGIALRQVQPNGRIFGAQICDVDLLDVLGMHDDEP